MKLIFRSKVENLKYTASFTQTKMKHVNINTNTIESKFTAKTDLSTFILARAPDTSGEVNSLLKSVQSVLFCFENSNLPLSEGSDARDTVNARRVRELKRHEYRKSAEMTGNLGLRDF